MTFSKASPFLMRSSFSGASTEPLSLYPAPVRRASEFDINYPPRYSTLIGSSPVQAPSNHIAPTYELVEDIETTQDDEASIAWQDNEALIVTPEDDEAIIPPGPPAYSTDLQRAHSLQPVVLTPPIIAPLNIQRSRSLFPVSQSRNNIHNHHYHITGSKAEPWATLKVNSQYSSDLDRQNTPHFTEGDSVRGVFELRLDTPQNINSISLSVSQKKKMFTTSYIYFRPSILVVTGPNHRFFL